MSYLVLSDSSFSEDWPFLQRKWRGVDMEERKGGEDLGGVEGEETLNEMYCLRE